MRLRPAALALGLLALLTASVSRAELETGGGFRARFDGSLAPTSLPRRAPAPIALRLHAHLTPIPGHSPPHLLRLRIEINRHALLDSAALPVCHSRRLRALTTAEALASCRDALVGSGHFHAHIDVPEQAPFPAEGRMLVFNSALHGHRALLGHVYGPRPTPTTRTLPIALYKERRGQFGQVLAVRMPRIGRHWGYVSGIDLTLSRRYRIDGARHSFLSASCPAPSGLRTVPFTAARGTFFLAGRTAHRSLTAHCTARP